MSEYKINHGLSQTEKYGSDHKTFQRNEHAIYKALNPYISKRSLSVCVRDICRDAEISVPTFYAHSANVDEAYRRYEKWLVNDFIKSVPETPSRISIFTILLGFIYRHRDYFRVALRNADFYILCIMLDRLRYLLVGANISNQAYLIYRNRIISVIMLWANLDIFNREKIDFYLHEIVKLRIWA